MSVKEFDANGSRLCDSSVMWYNLIEELFVRIVRISMNSQRG